MAIWLPEREIWTGQPDSPRPLNRDNPLAGRCVVAAYPGSGEIERCSTGVNATLRGGALRYWEFSGSGDVVQTRFSRSLVGINGVRGQDISVFLILRPQAVTADGTYIAQRLGGTIATMQVFVLSQNLLWKEKNNTAIDFSYGNAGGYLNSNTWGALGFVDTVSTTTLYYTNTNGLVGSVITATPTSGSSAGGNITDFPISIGARWNSAALDTAFEFDGRIALAVIWERPLAEPEMRSMFKNPWQIFE